MKAHGYKDIHHSRFQTYHLTFISESNKSVAAKVAVMAAATEEDPAKPSSTTWWLSRGALGTGRVARDEAAGSRLICKLF